MKKALSALLLTGVLGVAMTLPAAAADRTFGRRAGDYIAPPEGYRAYVDHCRMLNVRAIPNGRIIDTPANREWVTVLPFAGSGGWARVIYRSRYLGYVGASYLTAVPTEQEENTIGNTGTSTDITIDTATSLPPSEGATDTATSLPPSEGATDTATSLSPSEGATDTATSSPPSEGVTDTATSLPPSEGATDTATSLPPSEGTTDTATSLPPSEGATNTATSLPPSEGVTDTATSSSSSKGTTDRAQEATPLRYAARSLAVPAYRQYDERWEKMTVGGSGETVRAVGCTVTCLAMSESYLRSAVITPADIVQNGDFDENGCICWPAGYQRIWDGDCLTLVYERLEQGIPVIVHARNNDGVSHWVIVTGFCGGEVLTAEGFTIHDPATVRRTTLADFFAAYPQYVKIAWYAGT